MSCANRSCVNFAAHRNQTATQSGSLTRMAGFPCSGFFTLYLIAITFLQGVAVSVDPTAMISAATMPGGNVSFAGAKAPVQTDGQPQVKGHDNNGQGCPNCNNNNIDDYTENTEIYNLRIKMIKARILAKLQMDQTPVLKQKPKDSRIAALLSNLNLIEEKYPETEPEDAKEDDYYGKTTKIIVFSAKAKVPPSRTRRNFSKNLVFQFKLEQKSLCSLVSSVSLWFHKRKSKQYDLNGKTLQIEARDMRSDREYPDTPASRARVMTTKVKTKKSGPAEWIVVDVKNIVELWFNQTMEEQSSNATDNGIYTLHISCLDCESEAHQLISSRGRLRPFLVIDLHKPRTLSRSKRSIDCVGRVASHCCRRRFYVNFTKIGWDSWIIYPKGFEANFCDGQCRAGFDGNNGYLYTLQKMSQQNLTGLGRCCTPSKMSALSMLYFDHDEYVIKRDIPNMRVDTCDCPYKY